MPCPLHKVSQRPRAVLVAKVQSLLAEWQKGFCQTHMSWQNTCTQGRINSDNGFGVLGLRRSASSIESPAGHVALPFASLRMCAVRHASRDTSLAELCLTA